MATIVGQIALELGVDTKQFKNQLRDMAKQTKLSTNSMTQMFGKVGKVIGAAFAVKKIADFAKSCIDLGSDLAEVQNVVDVTFGGMSDKVNDFAKNAMNSHGLSEKVAKQYMGTFGAMSKAFGYTTEAAYDQAAALTGLAGDVASFYNLTTDEAYTKLKSVFTGETESLKDLGVVMTQTALDEYALQKGMSKTTSQMSEQEKVALRLAFVTDRLSTASGDFARTSDGWANQTRVLGLRFEALKATIGQGLINVLTPIVRVLNEIIKHLQVAADAFNNFTAAIFGKADTSSAVAESASATGVMSENLSDGASAAAKIKKSLAGFDQLNLLSSDSGSDSSSSGASSGTTVTPTITTPNIESGAAGKISEWVRSLLAPLSEVWDSFRNLASTIADVMAPACVIFYDTAISPMVKWLGEKLVDALSTVKGLFDSWAEWFASNKDKIATFAKTLGDVVAGIWNFIEPIADAAWGTFKDTIRVVSDIFQGFFQWVLDNQTAALAALNAILAAFLAYKTITGIITIVEAFKKGITTLTAVQKALTIAQAALNAVMAINPMTLIIAGVVALVAAFVVLWNKCDAFRNFWIGLWENIKAAFSKFIAWISPAIESVKGFFVSLWNGIVTSLQPLISSITGTFKEAWALIKVVWSAVSPFFKGIWDAIKSAVEIVKNVVVTHFQNAWEMTKLVWSVAVSYFKTIWENIKLVFSVVKTYLSGAFKTAWEAIKAVWNIVVGYFTAIWSSIKGVFSVVKSVLTGDFEGAWNGIKGIVGTWVNYFKNVWTNIKNVFSAVKSWFSSTFSAAWNAVKGVFSNWGSFFSGLWNKIKDTFSKIGTNIGNAISNSVKAGINGVISALEGKINTAVNLINGAIKLINKIPGVNIGKLSTLNLPRLATGGYVAANTPQLAIIGDNKREGEIVAPESKIAEAVAAGVAAAMRQVAEILNARNSNNSQSPLVIRIGERDVWQGFVDYHNSTVKRTGNSPLLI